MTGVLHGLLVLLVLAGGGAAWGASASARLLYHSGVAGEIDPCG